MLKIELFQTAEPGFTVIVGDRFADGLCPDEALGVVASALFGSGAPHPYLKTYEQWHAYGVRYREWKAPVALIEHMPCGAW
jgi:hypothetical protein